MSAYIKCCLITGSQRSCGAQTVADAFGTTRVRSILCSSTGLVAETSCVDGSLTLCQCCSPAARQALHFVCWLQLEMMRSEEPEAKALIFSQFAGTLDWLKLKLAEHGFDYRFISGSMSATQRDKVTVCCDQITPCLQLQCCTTQCAGMPT